jgi:beta-glucosidase
VALKPGQAKQVEVRIDPRLLAVYDAAAHDWRIRPGSYDVMLAASSRDIKASAAVSLRGRVLEGR